MMFPFNWMIFRFHVNFLESTIWDDARSNRHFPSNSPVLLIQTLEILDSNPFHCVVSQHTPLKTNMSLENQWLEDAFPTEIVTF